MNGDVKKVDVSSGYGSMSSHIVYQLNDLKSSMNDNDRDDMYMNDNLQNEYLNSGIGLTNSYTITQCN